MFNIRIEIEYDGTNYCGWQIQRGRKKCLSIQEVLEKTLQKILQEKVKVVGSGRTDAGVHAFAQIANFKTQAKLDIKNIQKALNSLLPSDIKIKRISKVPLDFNACYSAKSKIYRYFIFNSKVPSVFLHRFSWHIPHKLDLKLMQQEARVLQGRHNFKSFCASGSSAKDTTRTIKYITIRKVSCLVSTICYLRPSLIVIEIEADGFLYNMVRNIVGTLVEIGRGKLKKGSLRKILLAKNRTLAGPTAPAKGLFLQKVNY